MKKTIKHLALNKETIRDLRSHELMLAAGGATTVRCTGTDACTDPCTNPCTGDTLRTLCV